MSSEDKEPYFDVQSAQGMFIPGMGASTNPLSQMQPHPQSAQPGPMFYNPNDYSGVGAAPNSWNPAPGMNQAQQQQPFQTNGPSMGDNAMGYQGGTQAYFGGVESNSSSSSQQTSPSHVPQQKVNDISYEASQYEPQLYSPNASAMFNPASNMPPSQIYNPNPQYSATDQMQPQNTVSSAGEESSQPGYAPPPPASSLFTPNSEFSNLSLQNYMNPVQQYESASASPPISQYSSNIPDITNFQPQTPEQVQEQSEIKYESVSPINPVDLHNRLTASVSSYTGTNQADQSYMNMAYSHNTTCSGGPVTTQMQPVNAYVSGEFQVDPSNMMIPSSSSQDYDILHSQGTWKDHNQLPDVEQTHQQHQQDGTRGFEQIDNAQAQSLATDDVSVLESVDLVEMIPSHESNQDIQIQDINLNENYQQNLDKGATNEVLPLSEPLGSLPISADDLGDSHFDNPGLNLEASQDIQSNFSNLKISEDENMQGAVGGLGSIPNLNVENRTNEVVTQDTQQDALNMPGYSYGPILSSSASADFPSNSNQQSYESRIDQAAGSSLPSTPYQSLDDPVPIPAAIKTEHQMEEIPQSSESPIPADGLHPTQADTEQNHQFPSPTSAFESRIRSQSTGSNNSTTSSQRSANSQANRTKQNHNLQPSSISFPPSTQESSIRQQSVPMSNPFNTNTMHSSHLGSQEVENIAAATSIPSTIEPTIPDIVRPLPSEQSGENLRTGAMVPLSSNHSLHSQALGHRTQYPPDPPAVSLSSALATSRPQPDVIQSPPEQERAQLHPSVAENTHTVMALKTSTPQPRDATVSSAPTSTAASQPAPTSSDPYLSRSLHNAHSDQPPQTSSAANPEPTHISSQSQPTNQEKQSSERTIPSSTPSSVPHQSAPKSDDSHRDQNESNRLHPAEHRKPDEDSWYRGHSDHNQHVDRRDSRDSRDPRDYRDTRDSRDPRDYHDRDSRDPRDARNPRDSRWDDYHRRHPDDYGRRDYRDDSKYSRERGWDSRDPRDDGHSQYNDDTPKSSHEYHSRPSSRQGDPASSHYSRQYGQYGREYDNYRYDDRYRDYDRRDPYYSYDRRNDRYYDSYHRYPEAYRQRSHYDDYYYDQYYSDYRYARRPEDDDARSVHSERSRVNEHDPNWDSRQGYGEQGYYDYNYSRGYDREYYDDSIMDESTLSNTYDESWQRLPQVPARQTPAKFSTPHTIFRFGPGGQLIKVLPNRPTENQPSTVEIHSLEIMLQDTTEAEDLRAYAGPLSKEQTHKNDVLQFITARSLESMKDMDLLDRRSTALIWDFLALLVRQNGSVLGTDIAELLTKDHSGNYELLQSPLEASRQRQLQLQQHRATTPNSISDDATGGSAASPVPEQSESAGLSHSVDVLSVTEKNCNRFRDLLLHGRKKDALEWAMKKGLWGHALLLASKTDSRTHAQVMLRFANSLPINDPLQTVYQLMSGRAPAAATCVSEEGWGDWRPHLAMILSNPTSSASLDMRAVLTMGDTLSSRGLLHASHFCYLMSSTPLGYYGRTTSKMVLLGANHTSPFPEFASLDSIRRTEIYEYAISLGKNPRSSDAAMVLPTFQLYKFIYACKLAEYGLIAQAFHYCERIAKSVCRSPTSYSATLVNQLVNVSDQLRHHDPQIHAGMADGGSPKWLESLRTINGQIQTGLIVPRVHGPASLLTVSNTPSMVSTSPTSDSPNDEIRFSAHTPDQDDDDEDVRDSGLPDSQVPSVQDYSQHHQYDSGYQHQQISQPPQVQMYPATTTNTSVPTHDSRPPSTMMMPDQSMQHQQTQNYQQGLQGQAPQQDPQMYGMQNYSQQQNFMQPSGQPYGQPSVPTQGFEQLASQANPLASASGYSGQTYQHQNSYGFNPEQQAPTPDEASERTDQVDYYDYMSKAHKAHHDGRSRTVSQSSQRSRASTLKGYDRTTPTSMMNHTDKGRRSRTTSENSAGRRSRKTSGEQNHSQPKQKKMEDEKGDTVKKSGSWSLFSWLSRRSSRQVHLPDDNNKDIVWDNDQQRWVDKNASEEELAPPAPPPVDDNINNPAAQNNQIQQPQMNQNQFGRQQPLAPTPEDKEVDFINGIKSSDLPPTTSSQKPPILSVNGDSQLTANRFSLKNLGGNRTMYKNAFSSSSTPAAIAPAPPSLLPGGLQNQPKVTGFMIPNPVPTSQPTSEEPSPAATSTPMHSQNQDSEAIPMFTPGNTPHGSATDFRQPFNHGGGNSSSSSLSSSAREVRNLTSVLEEESSTYAQEPVPTGPSETGPTMFFNPSQFSAPPDLVSQPSMTASRGRGNLLRRGRGRPGYPGRR